MQFISSKKGQIQQGDQGALNAVLSHDTRCLEPRFNSVTVYYDFNYGELLVYRKPIKGFYSEEQIREATEHPVIIHFTTSFLSRRLWIEGCRHRYVGEWMRYKNMTPWRDSPLWEYKPAGGVKCIYVKMCKMMPRGWVIGLSGLMQAYSRPWIIRMFRRINC